MDISAMKLAIGLFLSLLVFQVAAYQWPVVNYVATPVVTSATSSTYNGSWITIEIPDALDGVGGQSIGIAHRHLADGSLTTGSIFDFYKISTTKCPGFKFSCMGTTWIKLYGSTGKFSINHSGGANGSECVGFVTAAANNSPWAQILIPNYNAANCIGTAPIPDSCALQTPEVQFSYGTLTSQTVSGAALTKTIQVECTAAVNYILKLQSTLNNIPLSNGMLATLTTDNNTALGSTLKGVAGINTLNLTSTLSGTPTSTGAFSGTGALVLSYP
jgi:hypothetical protein